MLRISQKHTVYYGLFTNTTFRCIDFPLDLCHADRKLSTSARARATVHLSPNASHDFLPLFCTPQHAHMHAPFVNDIIPHLRECNIKFEQTATLPIANNCRSPTRLRRETRSAFVHCMHVCMQQLCRVAFASAEPRNPPASCSKGCLVRRVPGSCTSSAWGSSIRA